jgi:SAM-dependent methyltransferase
VPQRSLKRLIAKLSWFFLHHQVSYNTEVLDTLSKDVLGEAGLVGRLNAHDANADAMGVEFRTLGRDLWTAIAAQTAHLDEQNGEMWAAIAAQSDHLGAQDAELWSAIAAQTDRLDSQNADLWKAIASQTDRLDAQHADLWSAISAQTHRFDSLAAEVWAAVAAQTDQLETLGRDLWQAVHDMWDGAIDTREVLDQEKVALKVHVDLMQRQAFARYHEGIGALRSELTEISMQMADIHTRLEAVPAQMRAPIDAIHKEIEVASAEVRRRQGVMDAFLDKMRRTLPEPPSRDVLERLPDAMETMYSDFEDTFRGTITFVTENVRAYLPDVLALDGHGPVVDLGCGRGEWLEVLKDAGVEAYGVDMSGDFVDQCQARGLNAVLADACEHLKTCPERSLSAVTAFHLVEHIPVDRLVQLIDLSVRALEPGGLLILETPNPENLIVGASDFYLDPSHMRPLPPALLAFLVEARGFCDVETRLLHPRVDGNLRYPQDKSPWAADLSPLVNLVSSRLCGPQDYAVIGRRL